MIFPSPYTEPTSISIRVYGEEWVFVYKSKYMRERVFGTESTAVGLRPNVDASKGTKVFKALFVGCFYNLVGLEVFESL